MASNDHSQKIDFVVGEEKYLKDVVSVSEVTPLLKGTIDAGVAQALLLDQNDAILWCAGSRDANAAIFELPIILEGEPVGKVVVAGPRERDFFVKSLCHLLTAALQTIATNNLKKLLTTEIHTTVVNQSYDELLESNKKLAASESKYRELAEHLEITVAKRTDELKKAHTKLIQQEKLAAVGQLAAGMAHEINNPLGFVASNLNTLRKYAGHFLTMLQVYREIFAKSSLDAETKESVTKLWQKHKLNFILTDTGDLLNQAEEGCRRITKIVADLKGFSHIDQAEKAITDLNREIENTLNVLAPQIPADAVIIKKLNAKSGFFCTAALLNQTFFNIILNAIQQKPQGLRLLIDTSEDTAHICIRFIDNGPGIPPEIINRVFEPFFTTKEVGAGIGLGLAVAYDAIASYGGTIEVQSQPGHGAAFTIKLPLTI